MSNDLGALHAQALELQREYERAVKRGLRENADFDRNELWEREFAPRHKAITAEIGRILQEREYGK